MPGGGASGEQEGDRERGQRQDRPLSRRARSRSSRGPAGCDDLRMGRRSDLERIDPYRLGDVLELRRTEIADLEIEA